MQEIQSSHANVLTFDQMRNDAEKDNSSDSDGTGQYLNLCVTTYLSAVAA